MISGKKVNLRLFKCEEEVREYFEDYNDLNERAITDHSELFSPLRAVDSFKENGWWSKDYGELVVTDNQDNPLGVISFSSKTELEFSIGYRINKKENRGKGYMGEALKLFSSYLFNSNPFITRLSLCTPEDNTPSRKMAEKCGYKLEGILRNAYFYRGKICNWTLYSILRDEV